MNSLKRAVGLDVHALAVDGEVDPRLRAALHVEDVAAGLERLDVEARRGVRGLSGPRPGDEKRVELREAALHPVGVDGRDLPVVPAHLEAPQLETERPSSPSGPRGAARSRAEVHHHVVGGGALHLFPGEEGGAVRGVRVADLGLMGWGLEHRDPGQGDLLAGLARRRPP